MNISLSEFLTTLNAKVTSCKGDIVILASSEEEALSYYSKANFFTKDIEVLHLPSLDSLPYDRVSPSVQILSKRAYVLSRLKFSKDKKILVTNCCNVLLKYPSPDELLAGYKEINIGDKISSSQVETFLLANGYERTSCAIDAGEYSRRGDILDIVLFSGKAYRINFGWDKVESIKLYDPETQVSSDKVEKIEIYQASELIFNQTNIENYKVNFLKFFGVSKAKELFFEKVVEGIKVPGIESVAPLFYTKPYSLFEYVESPAIYASSLIENALNEFVEEFQDFYESRISTEKIDSSFYPAASPEFLIYDRKDVVPSGAISVIHTDVIPAKAGISLTNVIDPCLRRDDNKGNDEGVSRTPVQRFVENCKASPAKKHIISVSTNYALEKVKNLLTLNEVKFVEISNIEEAKKNIVNLALFNLEKTIATDEYFIASEIDILGEKRVINSSSKKRLKNIFKEIENFNEGELVVHIEHGVGRYETIEHVIVDNIQHDCLKIVYAKGDRLFIPVENIGLLKRYGSNEVELDHLGGVSWQRRKSKLKDRVGELALSLMKIAATRKMASISPIDFSAEDYSAFCAKFPFVETEDQQKATEDILADLQEDKPMDRLICGDVGFGKTEVAMRAAFLVAGDRHFKKQVAIVVPTTILARQHYNNFLERFQGFGFRIKQISRFVTPTEAKKVKEEIAAGTVDIVVGTHALLASEIKFANLGLVIVDEEQHFGVLQKEKLKELKESIHSLTLSATPIPRTLQMSLLGIKDLSLIATPPIDRLAVRTSVISFDEIILRDALMREKFRGGKSFFVAPRVADLNELYINIKDIAPELKVKIAHGQLSPATIDDIMTEFYEGKFDVLLSTAIVESGLDIPSANTMIIYKAEMFGLSQLYQLRGRVGRAKVRGYAYLVLDRKKMPTKSAIKRLEIMQSLDSLGAGFSIASHDMDVRGFGNLVGDEQSGHIKEVGVELYQEMLEEAVALAKGEQIVSNDMPNIKINVPVFIPEDYITDQTLRLSIYRRAGDIREEDEVEDFRDELGDRFGKIPEPVNNLLEIMSIKIKCKEIGIEQLDLGSGGFNVKFSSKVNPDMVVAFLAKYPRHTKVKPDNRLVYIKNMLPTDYLRCTKEFIGEFCVTLYTNSLSLQH